MTDYPLSQLYNEETEQNDTDLHQEMTMNIVIDTGDLNTDFTENNLCNYCAPNPSDIEEGESIVSDNSSLLWLCTAQGISKAELEEAIMEGTGYTGEAALVIAQKKELNYALQKLGKDIHFDKYHTGPYRKYLDNRKELCSLHEKKHNLKATLEANFIIFSEYQNIVKAKNLPMNISNEDTFLHHQAEVLHNIHAKLYIIEEKINRLSQITPEIQDVAQLSEELSVLLDGKYKPISQTEAFRKMKFLESILDESRESTTHMNALTFCVKMPYKQAQQIQQLIEKEQNQNNSYYAHERTGNSYIVLDKNTTCGLYDPWNGAGGQFDIQLIKDVTLPIKYIYSMDFDGALGYSIENIYGRGEEMWTSNSVKDVVAVEPDIVKGKDMISSSSSLENAALKDKISHADKTSAQSQTKHTAKDIPTKER